MAKKSPTKMMHEDLDGKTDSVEDSSTEESTQKEKTIESGVSYIDLPSKGKLGYESSVSYRDILVKDEEVLSRA